ncbi:hypothetical protein [Bradyrhizobium sp. LHD-71]|uniref:hypothetical protein n=1 Tax=Bradyrhizobium sp. LHD-71 TaxID=3072141 RepID=UPI0028105A70|nr:hypothetical protein [Bradyrhizobium sp. LHD-71]MDQ8730091.1 hypothetical protein [Bradyrhizobium sp. LHD-71]
MSDFGVSDADMQREINRGALQQFWDALLGGRNKEAVQIYLDDAIVRIPQSEDSITGRADIAARGLLAAGESLVKVNSIIGDGGLWVSECETLWDQQPTLLVSITEMNDGKIIRDTRYRAPKHQA